MITFREEEKNNLDLGIHIHSTAVTYRHDIFSGGKTISVNQLNFISERKLRRQCVTGSTK